MSGPEKLLLEKRALRKHYLALRAALAPEARACGDAAICRRLLALPILAAAPGVVAYAADGAEPDLGAVCARVLAAGKVLALPRFVPATGVYEAARVLDLARDLVPGKYGLAEPRGEMERVVPGPDWLWLVPGVAFDEFGARLGRGGGFYDRLLTGAGWKIGVFRQMQFHAGALPCEAHDCKLDMAVTEIQTYSFCSGTGGTAAAPEHDNQRKNPKQ